MVIRIRKICATTTLLVAQPLPILVLLLPRPLQLPLPHHYSLLLPTTTTYNEFGGTSFM